MVTFAYYFFFYTYEHFLWLNCSKLAINSKYFVQRIFFESLYRVYKTSKLLRNVLYECPCIKYVPSKFCSFIYPVLHNLLGYPSDDLFSNNVRTLSSIPQYQTKIQGNCCFVSYLRKSILLTFLFSESHVGADKPGGQYVKHNVCG